MQLRQLFLFLFVSIFIVSCSQSSDNQGTENEDSSFVYGLTFSPSGFDPHIHQSAELGIVLRQVYDTLVYRDPDTNDIVAGLASEWTISEDGLTYTFTLQEGVEFHDGTPFNAEAVAINLDRITDTSDAATASQRARFMLGSYTGYEVIDEYTIQLLLSEPYVPLLDALSQVYLAIASPSALNEYSRLRYQFHQVGTGPYRFVEYMPEDRIILRRNDAYSWGPEFYNTPEEYIDEITFRFFVDAATRTQSLESGDAQIMGEIPPTQARGLTVNSQLRLIPTTIPGQPLQFLMNTQNFPTDNVLVRQALIIATNRSGIVDTIYQGFSPIAWGPLASETLYYNRNLVNTYEYNPSEARRLLESAGFVDNDNNGYLDVGSDDFEIVIVVPPWSDLPTTAQLIQDQWREIGIRATLRQVVNFGALLDAVESGDYHLVSFNTFGLDPSFLNQYFVTGASQNWTGYSNPELDSILLSAVQESDEGIRRGQYLDAQRIIMEQALILPIRDYVNLNATQSNIEGLQFDPYGWFPLLNNVVEVNE